MGRRRTKEPLASEIGDSLHGSFPDEVTDLHGMTELQARKRVDLLLDRWARKDTGAVLRIVTGRGNRSPGAAVLLDAVGDLLRDEVGGRVDEVVRDAGGGGWLVRVRSRV